MPDHDLEMLKAALIQHWTRPGGEKVQRYIDQFYARKRIGTKILALVEGNHGTYTVSIRAESRQLLTSACSCYIGKHGGCHHCAALAATFLKVPDSFTVTKPVKLEEVHELSELRRYLDSVTLDDLIKKLQARGITQKAFAESMGMSSRHLSAVKSSELRNRYFHELGATKLACLWVLEHFAQTDE